MKISSVPPHTRPVSYLGSWFKLKVSVRGFSSSITSRAACHTSASTQPPPIVPLMLPSSSTSILAEANEGIDPRALTIVARAPRLPARLSSTISSKISILTEHHFTTETRRNGEWQCISNSLLHFLGACVSHG